MVLRQAFYWATLLNKVLLFSIIYEYYVNCGHTTEMKMWSSQLWLRFRPKKWAMGSNPVKAPKTIFGLNLRLLKSQSQLWWSHLRFIFMSAVHIIFIWFIPFRGIMKSINWRSPNVWAFIAHLVEHCSAKAEAMGSNPVEAPQTFFRA